MGRIIIRVKKDIKEKCENGAEERKTEGEQARKIIIEKDKWNIVAMYNKQGITEIMKKIKGSENKEENLLIEILTLKR